jgi:hypothetical protein
MSTESLCGDHVSRACPGVHCDWLADDEAIGDELADGLTGVCVGDLGDLVWVKPDLALSASNNGRRKALLGAKVNPTDKILVHADQKLLLDTLPASIEIVPA